MFYLIESSRKYTFWHIDLHVVLYVNKARRYINISLNHLLKTTYAVAIDMSEIMQRMVAELSIKCYDASFIMTVVL